MKIYFAAAEPHNMKDVDAILLSYYDLVVSTIPFRKGTFLCIQELYEKTTIRKFGQEQTGRE
jgi:hypothetical protein